MLNVPHPEVLAPDYVPPTLPFRTEAVARLLAGSSAASGETPVAAVRGPSGSGTSAVARLVARRWGDDLRRSGAAGGPPVVVAVRLRWCRGVQSAAGALVQCLDEGFKPEGFPTNEILAGFLRRLHRDRRPAVVVLDDLGRSTPDPAPIVRALRFPHRFLPEGVDRAPWVGLVLAGHADAESIWNRAETAGIPSEAFATLRPYSPAELREILRDRLARALGRPAPETLLEELVGTATALPGGASRAMTGLRRTLLGAEEASERPTLVSAPGAEPFPLESHLLEALERSGRGRSTSLGAIRSWEARLAREGGRPPMPATTLWRRLMRLEGLGLVRRTVRPGGPGGTRSTVELLEPVTDWPVRPAHRGTPRAVVGGAPVRPPMLVGEVELPLAGPVVPYSTRERPRGPEDGGPPGGPSRRPAEIGAPARRGPPTPSGAPRGPESPR